MNIYCTYLTVYNGNLMPKFYIGSTSVYNIEKGYHGSVSSKKYKKIWELEIKQHPELFRTKILTIHHTREEAITREIKFHEALGVDKNPMYINMATARGRFYHFNGPRWSEERRKALSERMKGNTINKGKKFKSLSEEHRKKISETKKKNPRPAWNQGLIWDDKVRENISKGRKGKYTGPRGPATEKQKQARIEGIRRAKEKRD